MRVVRVLAFAAAAAVACTTDQATAPPPAFDLRIISPNPTDSLYESDSLLILGEATRPDVGLLPDDSLTWTWGSAPIGTGHLLRTRLTAGIHPLRLHARWDGALDSVEVELNVTAGGLGRVLWLATAGIGFSPVAGLASDENGVLYTTDSSDRFVVALRFDGSVLWRTSLSPGFISIAVPAVGTDGNIYLGADRLMRIAPDGSIGWAFYLWEVAPPNLPPYQIHSSPAIGPDGTLYVASEDNDTPIYAFHPDGSLQWRTPTDSRIGANEFQAAPVLVGDSLVVALQRYDSVVAVHATTGQLRWKAGIGPKFGPGGQRWVGPAVGSDGTIYLAALDTLRALTPSGIWKWQRRIGPTSSLSAVCIRGSRLYVGTDSAGVLVYSLSGDSLAVYGSRGTRTNARITLGARGVIYVATVGRLVSYDSTGVVRFATPIDPRYDLYGPRGGPIIGADGTVYVRAGSGVYAIRDTIGPATDSEWPGFQGGPRRQGRR